MYSSGWRRSHTLPRFICALHARDRIRTDIRLVAGRAVWITRFPCLFIPASGLEPGAAIGSASTSAHDHQFIVFGAPLPFRLRERLFCFLVAQIGQAAEKLRQPLLPTCV